MVVLGLILIVIAVVAGVVLVYENSDTEVTIHAFGGQWQAHAYWLAIIGAAVLVVAVLGLAMIRAGSRRGLRRRQERKQLERENAALSNQVARSSTTPPDEPTSYQRSAYEPGGSAADLEKRPPTS